MVLFDGLPFSASLRLRGEKRITHVEARRPDSGFSYIMVLVAVVVVGILAEAATLLTSRMAQADREQELLFRGQAYKNAVESYYRAGGTYPRALEDLLKDPRTPGVKRHIRALYPDPFAKGDKKEWTLIRAPDGGIAGVASISTEEPLKKANFPKGLEKFEGAKSYADWKFEFNPGAATPRAAARPLVPVIAHQPGLRYTSVLVYRNGVYT